MKVLFKKPTNKNALTNFRVIITDRDWGAKWFFVGTIWKNDEEPDEPGNITYAEVRVGPNIKKLAGPEINYRQKTKDAILKCYRIEKAKDNPVFKGEV